MRVRVWVKGLGFKGGVRVRGLKVNVQGLGLRGEGWV